jgi:hypothetical protein
VPHDHSYHLSKYADTPPSARVAGISDMPALGTAVAEAEGSLGAGTLALADVFDHIAAVLPVAKD